MVELVIVGEKDGKVLRMKTDDGKMVLEHKVGKEDKLKWSFTNHWYWSVFFSLLELNFLVYIALYAVDVIQYAAVVIRAGNGLSQLWFIVTLSVHWWFQSFVGRTNTAKDNWVPDCVSTHSGSLSTLVIIAAEEPISLFVMYSVMCRLYTWPVGTFMSMWNTAVAVIKNTCIWQVAHKNTWLHRAICCRLANCYI